MLWRNPHRSLIPDNADETCYGPCSGPIANFDTPQKRRIASNALSSPAREPPGDSPQCAWVTGTRSQDRAPFDLCQPTPTFGKLISFVYPRVIRGVYLPSSAHANPQRARVTLYHAE